MKGIYYVEEGCRKEEPVFTKDEISTMCMCLAAVMTLIAFAQLLIAWQFSIW